MDNKHEIQYFFNSVDYFIDTMLLLPIEKHPYSINMFDYEISNLKEDYLRISRMTISNDFENINHQLIIKINDLKDFVSNFKFKINYTGFFKGSKSQDINLLEESEKNNIRDILLTIIKKIEEIIENRTETINSIKDNNIIQNNNYSKEPKEDQVNNTELKFQKFTLAKGKKTDLAELIKLLSISKMFIIDGVPATQDQISQLFETITGEQKINVSDLIYQRYKNRLDNTFALENLKSDYVTELIELGMRYSKKET